MSAAMRAAFVGWVLTSSVLGALDVAVAQSSRIEESPIIDAHMHAEPGDPRFGITLNHELTGSSFTASANEEAHFAECLALMRRLNVVRAVVSGGTRHEGVLRWKE